MSRLCLSTDVRAPRLFPRRSSRGRAAMAALLLSGVMVIALASTTASAQSAACAPHCTLLNDPDNCGHTAAICRLDEHCIGGNCVAFTCPQPTTVCGGACVDVTDDKQHCGSCGNACGAGMRCSAGNCVPNCAPGQSSCGARCADLTRDPFNCGSCGNVCSLAEQCISTGGTAQCTTVCPPGADTCGTNTCIDLRMSSTHCGSCGNSCGPGERCNGKGICTATCSAGTTRCGGACVELDYDNDHCGACGVACPVGTTCNGTGTCAASCAPGFTGCAEHCVDLDRHPAHCGACGVACGPGQGCVDGQCRVLCQPGLTECGGSCVDLDYNDDHCGACGVTCDDGQRCGGAGQCTTQCGADHTICSGRCVDPQSDDAHCGGCGQACQTVERCIDGVCELRAGAAPRSAASTVYVPYWSLLDGDETLLVLRSLDAAADLTVTFYDALGNARDTLALTLADGGGTTLDLRDLGLGLEAVGAGALLIEPASGGASPALVAETQVFDDDTQSTLVFAHIALVDGVWRRFSGEHRGLVGGMRRHQLLVFCPTRDLELDLLALGELPGLPASGLSREVELAVVAPDGTELTDLTVTCDAVTRLKRSDLDFGAGNIAVDSMANGTVELRAPEVFFAPLGRTRREHSAFVGYNINAPVGVVNDVAPRSGAYLFSQP